MDFENEHFSLIMQYESSALEIERIFFTRRYNLSKKHLSLLSVQSISILYSYWEGYIQNSFRLYIEYINSMKMDFNDLSDEIVVYHMDKTFKQFVEYPENFTKKVKFFNALKEHFINKRHDIDINVNTESNVGFKVLNKLLSQLSLEKFPEQWGKYSYPNANLKESLNTFLRYRNGVAHGGDISSEEKISQTTYSKYRCLVIDLMYAMHDRFMEGIAKKSYMKNQHSISQ